MNTDQKYVQIFFINGLRITKKGYYFAKEPVKKLIQRIFS